MTTSDEAASTRRNMSRQRAIPNTEQNNTPSDAVVNMVNDVVIPIIVTGERTGMSATALNLAGIDTHTALNVARALDTQNTQNTQNTNTQLAVGPARLEDWSGLYNYLLGTGMSKTTIKQYIAQAKRFYALYYRYWLSSGETEEQLFQKINQFVQVVKVKNKAVEALEIGDEDDGDEEKYRLGNKRFTMYALRRYFMYVGLGQLYQRYYEKYGHNIKSFPRKIASKALTIEQISEMYKELQEPFKTLFGIEYETGCRINELLMLRPENIRENKDNTFTLSVMIKGGHIRHLMIVNKATTEAIKNWNLSREFVFTDVAGQRLNYGQVIYEYKKVAARLWKKNISTHWLRHSRGVHIYEKNKDIMEVKEVLGHKNLQETYTYLKSSGVDLKETMKKNPVPFGD